MPIWQITVLIGLDDSPSAVSNASKAVDCCECEWTSLFLVGMCSHHLFHCGEESTMTGRHRVPDFSVVVWIRKNEDFTRLQSEVLAAAEAEPYETTEYHGMVDFHWGMTSIVEARKLAEASKVVSERPEVVLLRIISLVDGVESISMKDERRHQTLD
jgi:hypothetical protein